MKRKGPWEGYRRQATVVSFPPSFARTFSSRERRLGTRQAMVGVCSTFSFATETTVELKKTALKTKTLRKALVFGSLFGRIGA